MTAAIAIRHLYIQHLPPGTVPACGAPLNYMLQLFSLSEVLVKVLTGSGECAVVTWRFLGLGDARLGAHIRTRIGRLWNLGELAPPGAGAALLMAEPSETLKLTQELISRPSVSPEDGGCQALMMERLRALKFSVETLRFGPVDNFLGETRRRQPGVLLRRPYRCGTHRPPG